MGVKESGNAWAWYEAQKTYFDISDKESPSVQRERARFAYNEALEALEVTPKWKAMEKAWEAVKATPEYKAFKEAEEAMMETPECKNCLEAQWEVEAAYMRTENGHLDGRYKWNRRTWI